MPKPKEIAQQTLLRRSHLLPEGLVGETVRKTIGEWDWDWYRVRYLAEEYTWQQLIEINNWWCRLLPTGRECFNRSWAHMFFAGPLHNRGVRVVELGCGEGLLAKYLLNHFGPRTITRWWGFDIAPQCMDHGFAHDRYTPHTLPTGPFWELRPMPKGDVFVCTHTIEHFNSLEADALLYRLVGQYKWVYLEAPLKRNGVVWQGGGSSHVLGYGTEKIKKILASCGYQIMGTHRGGGRPQSWQAAWRRAGK